MNGAIIHLGLWIHKLMTSQNSSVYMIVYPERIMEIWLFWLWNILLLPKTCWQDRVKYGSPDWVQRKQKFSVRSTQQVLQVKAPHMLFDHALQNNTQERFNVETYNVQLRWWRSFRLGPFSFLKSDKWGALTWKVLRKRRKLKKTCNTATLVHVVHVQATSIWRN